MLEVLPDRQGNYKEVLAQCDCGVVKRKDKDYLRKRENPTCRECYRKRTETRFKRAEATREERAAFHAGIGKKKPKQRKPDETGQLPLLVNGVGRVCKLHGIPMKLRLENRISKYQRKDGGVTPFVTKDRARWECPLCNSMRRPGFQAALKRIIAGDMPPGYRLSKHQRAALPAEVVTRYDEEMEARREERRQANRDRARVRRYQVKYGLTPEEVELKVDGQDGICPICQRKKPLVVDHCHRLGHVRDLLCGTCNTGLGSFDDNSIWLYRAAMYVHRHTAGK